MLKISVEYLRQKNPQAHIEESKEESKNPQAVESKTKDCTEETKKGPILPSQPALTTDTHTENQFHQKSAMGAYIKETPASNIEWSRTHFICIFDTTSKFY